VARLNLGVDKNVVYARSLMNRTGKQDKAKDGFIDPICGMTVDPATAAGSFDHDGKTHYFCSKGCLQKFIAQAQTVPASGLVGTGPNRHVCRRGR
jgi:YHS domain-containing protein